MKKGHPFKLALSDIFGMVSELSLLTLVCKISPIVKMERVNGKHSSN